MVAKKKRRSRDEVTALCVKVDALTASGDMKASEACEQVGINRNQYYSYAQKKALAPRKASSLPVRATTIVMPDSPRRVPAGMSIVMLVPTSQLHDIMRVAMHP